MSKADTGGAGHISPLPPHLHPARILLLQTTVGGWTMTWYSLQMAGTGRMILQPYSVLVNDCDQEF